MDTSNSENPDELAQNGEVLYYFLGTVKAAPHECVIRTGQP